jgi:tRNA uridine 5-carboxymethylaminomethyl modification enzyme
MVDDLTLQGVTEPYRMLTARAEYRLRLRADNAEIRLTPQALAAGCVSPDRRRHFEDIEQARERIEAILGRSCSASVLSDAGVQVRDDGVRRSLGEWLRFPELDRAGLCRVAPELCRESPANLDRAIQDYRYAPYVARQEGEIERMRADDSIPIPTALDFTRIAGLSNEMIERLSRARPTTLGAAARIRGITPAALAAILVHSRRKAA